MDYETLYTLYQSRKTILNILAGRGYDTAPYEKFGPVEISAMANAGGAAMRMDLEKKGGAVADAATGEGDATLGAVAAGTGPTKCRVIYALTRIKNRMATFMSELLDEEKGDPVDPATTEVMVILAADVMAEAFHTIALTSYANKSLRLRISFFQANQLVNNPLEHTLVPKHEVLPRAEHEAFLAAHKIKSKANLPIIKFHEDMIARVLGLLPGDIVKISSFSPAAGEYLKYRVCAP
jgi:DNA-directed RNA polymerase subunit H (RpoH/RPB5)